MAATAELSDDFASVVIITLATEPDGRIHVESATDAALSHELAEQHYPNRADAIARIRTIALNRHMSATFREPSGTR